MDALNALVPDPRLAVLLTPVMLAFLGGMIAGLVQCTRKLRVDSGWLPFISGGWGIVVGVVATIATGVALTSSVVGFMVIYGLGLGLFTTGIVTVAVHVSAGTTDGDSTVARTHD